MPRTSDSFKLPSNATKATVIKRYKELLDLYQTKVSQTVEAAKQQSETDKHADRQALVAAESETVTGVVNSVGNLRTQLTGALNELTEQLSERAQQLEVLSRAVALKESQVKELHDLEAGADALSKLMGAYEDRSGAAEAEFEARLAEMEQQFQERTAAQDQRLASKIADFEGKRTEAEAKWATEVAKRVAERADSKLSREREQSEYIYNRDRERRIEEDAYQEQRKSLERELVALKTSTEADLTEREAAVATRESRLAELEAEVAAFPVELQTTTKRIQKETEARLRLESDHATKLAHTERQWEQKVHTQRVTHLESVIAEQRDRIEQLTGDLAQTRNQVRQIAEKAIEGASHTKAYQSVNEIALEQARRPESPRE